MPLVCDVERTRVIEVLNARKQEDLETFFWSTPLEHISTLESVSMGVWPAYINAARGHIEDRGLNIRFGRDSQARFAAEIDSICSEMPVAKTRMVPPMDRSCSRG